MGAIARNTPVTSIAGQRGLACSDSEVGICPSDDGNHKVGAKAGGLGIFQFYNLPVTVGCRTKLSLAVGPDLLAKPRQANVRSVQDEMVYTMILTGSWLKDRELNLTIYRFIY